ncbi:hypothetical protein OH76DRAFT_1487636 [Lentinus brumalis]|uniref:Uncharacterized protein n=1 Tax=Lentinus brumalis TaxID=2498619 RepID=A0A371CTX4_9APHY|nr:hypothetical protein OH76DRAFT_1487636 [Polyporus brumalis]
MARASHRGPGGSYERSSSMRAARQPVTPTAATTSSVDSKNGSGGFRAPSAPQNSARSPASFAPLLAGDRPNLRLDSRGVIHGQRAWTEGTGVHMYPVRI